jgi:hypothetical protein
MGSFSRWILCALIIFATASFAQAAEIEVRDFTTKIDGKPAGETHMTITPQEDGSVAMACQADVKVTKLGIIVYQYVYRGNEVWKAGKLLRLESSTNDNGKRYKVTATADANGMRVRVLDEERIARVDWLTSYWQLPDAEARKRTMAVLDADTGKTVRGAMRNLGSQQLTVAGKNQNCSHYRISGPLTVEAWFDAQDRLVRQEWMEDGHTCVLELSTIRRR